MAVSYRNINLWHLQVRILQCVNSVLKTLLHIDYYWITLFFVLKKAIWILASVSDLKARQRYTWIRTWLCCMPLSKVTEKSGSFSSTPKRILIYHFITLTATTLVMLGGPFPQFLWWQDSHGEAQSCAIVCGKSFICGRCYCILSMCGKVSGPTWDTLRPTHGQRINPQGRGGPYGRFPGHYQWS